MIGAIKKIIFSTITAGLLSGAASLKVEAGEAVIHAPFTNLSASGRFVKDVYVYTQGRITVDAAWTPQKIELKIALRRPDGSIASQISGAGGSLTLSYTATQQEISRSINAGHIKWKVEATRGPGAAGASGKLRISRPWEAIPLLQDKQFKLGPAGNAAVAQYTHTETFKVLAPGTIRISASWMPQTIVSAFLAQDRLGAVVKKDGQGPFEVSHRVSEQSLKITIWTCAFQNLSQKAVMGKVSISFVPDH